MTAMPDKIVVVLDSGERVEAEVLDFHPYEPAAYVTDPGWTTMVGETELFVSESGDVYEQPENKRVGVAPEIEQMSEAVARADELLTHVDKSMQSGFERSLGLAAKVVAPACTICGATKKWSRLLQLWVCPNGARCVRGLIRP